MICHSSCLLFIILTLRLWDQGIILYNNIKIEFSHLVTNSLCPLGQGPAARTGVLCLS